MDLLKPRHRRKEQNKTKILDAARKIIVQRGLAGFSMRLLASEVDYSPAAIYQYFHSKQEILQAIREEYWQLIFTRRAELNLEGDSPAEKLTKVANAYFETAVKYPEHYMLMFNSRDETPADVSEIRFDSRLAGLINIISEGVVANEFMLPQGYDASMMALQFWAGMHGMIMLRLTFMRNAPYQFDVLCLQMIRGSIESILVR